MGGVPSRVMTVTDAVAFFVGIVIGVGIFKTPSLVAGATNDPWTYISLWVGGGLATIVGALCYAELAAMFPETGGEYTFLSRAYGRRLAALFAWARGAIIQPGAIALVAFVLGDYAVQLLPLGAYGSSIYAALCIIVLTWFNIRGTRAGTWLQKVLEAATIAAIIVVIVAGLSAPAAAPSPPSTGSTSALGFAMVMVLLSYGGWNEIAYLSGEMKDVRRDMVRAILIGTAVVTTLYVGFNVALLKAFGLAGIASSQAVGADLLRVVAGQPGVLLLAVTVCLSSLSTLNGTIFTGARSWYALGRDVPLVQRFGVWNSQGDNPTNAFLLQAAISLALVALGALTRDGFTTMVEYTAPVFWFFLLLVGCALFVFRLREPGRTRPFRVPLYPLTPALFVAICGYLLWSSLAYTGYGALFGVAVLAAGLPLAWFASGPAPDGAEAAIL